MLISYGIGVGSQTDHKIICGGLLLAGAVPA